MDNTVERLRCSWVKQPRGEWIGDLEKMAEGYPFEKRRRRLQQVDRTSQLHRSLKAGSDRETHFLAAHFGATLVGWLRVRHHRLHAKRAAVPVYRADWELVQRNRDDVRGSMLQAVREKFPRAVVHFHQPAQNRTARRFLATRPDVLTGERELYLARENPSPSVEPHASSGDLHWEDVSSAHDPEVEDLLRSYRHSRLHHGPLFGTETARRIHVDWFMDRVGRESFKAEGLRSKNRLVGVVATRPNPKSFPTGVRVGSLSYIQVHPGERGRNLGRRLLFRGFENLTREGVKYVETKLCDANRRALGFYRHHGMKPVTKRRYFHLVTATDVELPL